MNFKTGLLLVALAIGCAALPAQPEDEDMSMFFDHVDPNWRIVGGVQAAEGSHPHMAALTTGSFVRSFMCGGSVISPNTVLTAAHCIAAAYSWGALSSTLRVTVGTLRWNSGGQTYPLVRNVTHQHYVSSTIKNDIGLLITAGEMSLTRNLVQPIPISPEFIGEGVPVTVAGWGRIRAGGAISATLLELTTSVLDGDTCAAIVAGASNARVEPPLEICTFHSHGHGTCNGDSGSALVQTETGKQIGIVSWGFACALGYPDMFTRTSAYHDWIQQNLS